MGQNKENTPTERTPRVNASAKPYVLVGLLVVLVMFGGLGAWAALVPLSAAVVAPAVITVHSNRKTVQHLEGGIVAEILARDGDFVRGGQVLIRLEGTRVRANLAIIDKQLELLRAREARLKAERDGAVSVDFSALLADRATYRKVASEEVMKGQRELFEARSAALQGQTKILTQQVRQLHEEISGLRAQQLSKARQGTLIQSELHGLRRLYKKGYVARSRILALERTGEQLEGERARHASDMARARKGVGESKLKIIQLKNDFREEVVQELREVQAQLFELEERRITALDDLTRVDIRSPQSGTIVGMDVHTVGAVITPGQPILHIVPEADELVIEAQVEPQHIDKLSIGLKAVIRFSAFDLRTTPELNGTVITVSADRLVDDATGMPYYQVRIRISDSELDKLGGLQLVPGMPAEAFINTGERTALSYLAKPFTDSLARALKDD